MFEGAEEKSKELGKFYKIKADELNCFFLDAGKIVVSSDLDGIHWKKKEHEKFGKEVAKLVLEILI